ncbi:unnamed protein product [Polarella glacialis]|uniref:Kinesin motor domain-containing protein n=1 Tax=Polarella glacialis TaxID=89957 RepID=A0A813DBL5_POLGL|nr:unnamed protein product [Polarella glacialis]
MAGQASRCPVRVVARFRPPDYPAFHVEPCGAVDSADLTQHFQFDRAFGQEASQGEVYDDVGRPIVDDVLSGYNGTVLAYGPTGSGKTFCMFGPPGPRSSSVLEGLVPRAVQQVLDHCTPDGCGPGDDLRVECSFFEVYCFSVEGLTHQQIHSADDALQILRAGLKLRVAANTKLNQHSSRSHAIFTLVLRQTDRMTESVRQRKLTLVDLAGSEKVRKSGSVGEMLEEAKKINSSLSTLGHVIEALADRRPHVPYRDSRLTRLLEDSLGGNCRTTLLVACSPSAAHISETLSSLRFAARAKKVENCARINISSRSGAGAEGQLQQRIRQLKRELARLSARTNH